MQINSERGRTEYNLVALTDGPAGLAAYPIGKGSGSVTTFSHADGFITIPQHTEIVPAGSRVDVTLLDTALEPADLVVVGSHCVGLDCLLSQMRDEGWRVKSLSVGSTAGLRAAQRQECDIAGVHLLDPSTGLYNQPFVDESLELIRGYGRMQAVLYRTDDARFAGLDGPGAIARAAGDANLRLVNRNPGSGTRILLDRLLGELVPEEHRRPAGYGVQAKSHNAVAAAIAQGRADWGLAIESVAGDYGLASVPLQPEEFDLLTPLSRRDRPAVRRLKELLLEPETQSKLRQLGCIPRR
ncbi:MAG: substrate-binding domain-containing protein [Planctomycetaceae bacterium]